MAVPGMAAGKPPDRRAQLVASWLGAGPRRGPGGPAGGLPGKPNVVTNAPGMNPYTGKPLGQNEYVGVAGSESEHPNMVRIPTPGWWDPSNPNYERRNYYIAPDGKTVALEAGFDPSSEDPWDTGREGEINAEYESMAGGQHINLGEPGIPRWSRGQERPSLPGYQAAPSGGGRNLADALGVAPRGGAADAAVALAGKPGARGSLAPLGGPPGAGTGPADLGNPQADYEALIEVLLGGMRKRRGPGSLAQ